MARGPDEIAKASRRAFEASQLVSHQERVDALLSIKAKLTESKDAILQANALDLEVRIGVSNPTQRRDRSSNCTRQRLQRS